MSRATAQRAEASRQGESAAAASSDELLAWVADVTDGTIEAAATISGGNRARSWAVDVRRPDGRLDALYLRYQPPRPPSAEPYTVWREAKIYRAIEGSPVPAPRIVATHRQHQAILTERVPGRADFRRVTDPAEKAAIARDCMEALATLHGLDVTGRDLPGGAARSIAAAVEAELGIWRAMYAETGRADPLIDLALDWLTRNLPRPQGRPVLVHGDAGPGNFLFQDGRMTALLDWELAHLGDPMEDLAWFSMRAVMEPVPDFPARVRDYERAAGFTADVTRIRYHRVFVSTRVVIIRHRNVTGEPGNSIVSRALNRRLLVEAIAEAGGITLPKPSPIEAPATERSALFDGIIDDLRDDIAPGAAEGRALAAVKNAAKVLKYLREIDRLEPLIEASERSSLERVLRRPVSSVADGQAAVVAAFHDGALGLADVLGVFAESAAHETQLAAGASGGLATRTFPPLEEQEQR